MGCKTADEVPLQGRCVNSLAQLAIKKYDPVRMYMKDYKYRLIVIFVVLYQCTSPEPILFKFYRLFCVFLQKFGIYFKVYQNWQCAVRELSDCNVYYCSFFPKLLINY